MQENKGRNKSFNQKIRNGNGPKSKGSKEKGFEFCQDWLREMETIVNDTHSSLKLVKEKSFDNCLCLVRTENGNERFVDQLHSCSSWQLFYLFWQIQDRKITSQNLTFASYETILDLFDSTKVIAHTCGNGRSGKIANKNPVCVAKSHLCSVSPKTNEDHKSFHFFLNYKSTDKSFQDEVRNASKELFKNVEPFKTLYQKHFG
jgi:hypothetical protein